MYIYKKHLSVLFSRLRKGQKSVRFSTAVETTQLYKKNRSRCCSHKPPFTVFFWLVCCLWSMDIASTTPKYSSPLRANHSAADLLAKSISPTLRPQLTRSQSTHSRNSSASSTHSPLNPHATNPSSLRHTVQGPISIFDSQEADIGETSGGYSTSYTQAHYKHSPASLTHSEPYLSHNHTLDFQQSPSGSYTTGDFSDEEEVSSRTSSSDVFGVGTMLEDDKDITELHNTRATSLSPDVLAKFRQWMVGFCVVNFDLEIGQGKKNAILQIYYVALSICMFY